MWHPLFLNWLFSTLQLYIKGDLPYPQFDTAAGLAPYYPRDYGVIVYSVG